MAETDRLYPVEEVLEDASILIIARQMVYSDEGIKPTLNPELADLLNPLVETDGVYRRALAKFKEATDFGDKMLYAVGMETRRMQILESECPEKVIITDEIPFDLFHWD